MCKALSSVPDTKRSFQQCSDYCYYYSHFTDAITEAQEGQEESGRVTGSLS